MNVLDSRVILKASRVSILCVTAGVLIFSANANASPYGMNITIRDGVGSQGIGPLYEDDEAEPGMVQSQAWDLEGFFLNKTNGQKLLTIVGGYNFYTGKDGMDAGDIFIDINGDSLHSPAGMPTNPSFGSKSLVSNSVFKYDYVLDIDWGVGNYYIVKLDEGSMLQTTDYGSLHNVPSNPWLYFGSGIVSSEKLSFNKGYGLSNSATGFSGWGGDNNHFAATFDISSITLGSKNYFHNTMECGNDNLIGYMHTPEPATLLLFGAGLAGIGAFSSRRKRKN